MSDDSRKPVPRPRSSPAAPPRFLEELTEVIAEDREWKRNDRFVDGLSKFCGGLSLVNIVAAYLLWRARIVLPEQASPGAHIAPGVKLLLGLVVGMAIACLTLRLLQPATSNLRRARLIRTTAVVVSVVLWLVALVLLR